jgi:uroporphyrin-III C-methyltransferase/precorrin-2 dehydrogenase/sirohydrochlorin ferrochelatase
MTFHVAPKQTRPSRLASLPKLPIFLDLCGKRAVVVGGNDAAAWKAELLAAAGAQVVVFAQDACEELRLLAAGNDGIAIAFRAWRDGDLDDALVVVAAEEDAELLAAARRRGVLVNVIDQPAFCDFQFGTIVNRAPVVIGISTDGAAPVLGQAIRRRIEAVLPPSIGGWATAAKVFRGRLKELLRSRAARRVFWEQFVNITFISQTEEDARLATLEDLAQSILLQKTPPPVGEVIIVGAGPGDPELLTLQAVRELQAADVILYDSLVAPAVLELGRREARRVLVGKRGRGAACKQEEISALMVAQARDGQRVVRLKGGDPAVFGRTGEELEACRSAGVPARVVAGVTSASAAAAALGLSLTHRDHSRRVQFVTGQDRHGRIPDDLDLDALADPHATTVIYMGRNTVADLARRLRRHGLPAETPVVLISNISHREETHVRLRLDEVAHGAAIPGDAGPLLILIGAALAAGDYADTAHPDRDFVVAAAGLAGVPGHGSLVSHA